LNVVPIEDEGGASAGGHWERTYFFREMMTSSHETF